MSELPKADYAIWVCGKHRTNGSFGECLLCREETKKFVEEVRASRPKPVEVDGDAALRDLREWEKGVFEAFGFDYDTVLRHEALAAIRSIAQMIGLPLAASWKPEPREIVEIVQKTMEQRALR